MDSQNKYRAAIAVLSLSAAGLIGILTREGYTERAIIPVPGDVPTIGFGTTTGVKLGDKTHPVQAAGYVFRDIKLYEAAIKQCIKVPLTQAEYDIYLDFSYNVGSGAFCKSTMAKKLNNFDYEGACNEFPKWTYVGKRDCRIPGNKCGGLVKDRERQKKLCLG